MIALRSDRNSMPGEIERLRSGRDDTRRLYDKNRAFLDGKIAEFEATEEANERLKVALDISEGETRIAEAEIERQRKFNCDLADAIDRARDERASAYRRAATAESKNRVLQEQADQMRVATIEIVEAVARDCDGAFRALTALNAAAYMHGRAQSAVTAIRALQPIPQGSQE